MQNVTIHFIGGLKETYYRDIAAEYHKRLGGYCKLTNLEAKNDAAIRSSLSPRSFKIALCVEGTMTTSEEFAAFIEREGIRSPSLEFIIGGAEGLEEKTKAMCNLRLSLSPMTLPHRLARIFLLEQIYRGYTILSNSKYHK